MGRRRIGYSEWIRKAGVVMAATTRDMRPLTGIILNAYLEMVLATFCLRVPEVVIALRNLPPDTDVSVGSSYPGQSLIIHIAAVLDGLTPDGGQLRKSITQINCVFVVAMWDTLIRHATFKSISKKPEVQFFRHVRNACAHDGLLNPRKDDLKQWRANWRDKEITPATIGRAVFPDLLQDGDLVLLFTDIQHLYFEPTTLPPGYSPPVSTTFVR